MWWKDLGGSYCHSLGECDGEGPMMVALEVGEAAGFGVGILGVATWILLLLF